MKVDLEKRNKILAALSDGKEKTIGEVAKLSGLSAFQVRNQLFMLALDGYMERITHSERFMAWRITDKGKAAATQTQQPAEQPK